MVRGSGHSSKRLLVLKSDDERGVTARLYFVAGAVRSGGGGGGGNRFVASYYPSKVCVPRCPCITS